MKLTRICLLLTLLGLVVICQSLRCARLCTFIRIPLNQIIPINACANITRNNSQCSLYVEIDRQALVATGRLGIENCVTTTANRVETIVKLNAALITIVRYTCKQDNCDTEFLLELFKTVSNIDSVGANVTKENIIDSIYDDTLSLPTINCTSSQRCETNTVCQGNYGVQGSSGNNTIELNGNPMCIKTSQDDYLLNIKESYWPNGTNTTEMIFRCNLENCLDDSISAPTTYEKLEPFRILNLFNDTAFDDNGTCLGTQSTGISIFLGYQRFIYFAITFLFFSQ